MASLTPAQREKLPASEFALPKLRKLPIHDKQHVVLAWGASDSLPLETRLDAKRAILRKAHALGVETGTWHLSSVSIEAMSMHVEDMSTDHVNRLPFSGVLAYIDEPSDNPPQGTNGKRVVLSLAAAQQALASLLGMAVDFTPAFDGHRPKSKIGLITSADIESNELRIAGYFWAADFPEEVALIHADRDKLGFSYECMSMFETMAADPLVIAACEFTGAAILYKDKAAYMKTSLAARADQGETLMDKDLETALAGLATGIATMTTVVKELPNTIKASIGEAFKANDAADLQTRIDAGKAQIPVLRSNAQTLRASGLETAAVTLETQANAIEAAVNAGKAPPEFKPGAAPVAASSAPAGGLTVDMLKTAFGDVLKPVVDGLASMNTKLEDTKLAISANGAAPAQRKSLTPATTQALARIGLSAGADGTGKIKVADLDEACKKANISSIDSTSIKLALKEAGQLVTA